MIFSDYIRENQSGTLTTLNHSSITVFIQIAIWFLVIAAWGYLIIQLPRSLGVLFFGLSLAPALVFFWFKPEFGLIAYLFIVAGFFPYNFIEIAKIEARDIVLFALLGLGILKGLATQDLRLTWWPNSGLMAMFLIYVVFSTAYGLFVQQSEMNWVLGEARMLIGYSIFFAIIWLVKDAQAFKTLLLGSILTATLLCSIIIIQQFYGTDDLFLPTMTLPGWHVWPQGKFVRVVSPTIIHIFMMLIVSMGFTLRNVLIKKPFGLWTLNTLIIGFGLLLTFTRSAWVSSILSMIFLTICLYPFYKSRLKELLFFGTAILICAMSGFTLLNAYLEVDVPIFSDISSRFISIFEVNETANSLSLQWRRFENQEAQKSIADSPFFGVGIGGSYRDITAFQGEARGLLTGGDISYQRIYRYTKFLHSGYMLIVVKMGIPAFCLFIFLYLKVIVDGFKLYLKHLSADKSSTELFSMMVIPCGLISLMFWAVFHEFFFSIGNTPFVGLVIGLMAVAATLLEESQPIS